MNDISIFFCFVGVTSKSCCLVMYVAVSVVYLDYKVDDMCNELKNIVR